jgi:hypothetical protein
VFLLQPKTSIKDLIIQCLEKLGVVEPEVVFTYFGLFESRNGGSVDGCLAMDSLIQDALNAWAEAGVEKTAKFLFMIRLYLPSITGLLTRDVVMRKEGRNKDDLTFSQYVELAEINDENVMHLQFIQAVYNIITGRYPTTADEAIMLGAIHFLMKFGKFRSEIHKVGFLGNRIVEFVPIKHLKSNGNLPDWEGKLFSKVQQLTSELVSADRNGSTGNSGDNSDEEDANNDGGSIDRDFLFVDGPRKLTPLRKYMEHLYKMIPLFGSTFFRCTQRCSRALPDVINLGIYHEGIQLFDKNKKLLKTFYIEDIYRWGFKPNQMFYFEISADNDLGTGSLEFETMEGKVISDLMTDYALAFLKEREREEVRASKVSINNKPRQMPPPPAPVNGKAALPPPPKAVTGPLSRGPLAHLYHDKPPQYRAAARIQALFRGFSLRNEWVREDAAILVQSIFRGYRARVQLSKMIEEMITAGEL